MKLSRTRILIYIASVFLLSALGSLYYWVSEDLDNASQQSRTIRTAMGLLGHLDKLNTSITYIERNEKPYLIAKDSSRADEIRSGYVLALSELDSLLVQCDNNFCYKKDIQLLDSFMDEKIKLSNHIIHLSVNGMPDSAVRLFSTPRDSLIIAGFVNKYNSVYDYAKTKVDKLVQEHAILSKKLYGVIVSLIIFSILFFLVIFWWIVIVSSQKAKLATQNELYADIIRISSESITIADADLKIIDCNPATEKLYKRSKEEIIGKFVDDDLWKGSSQTVIDQKNRALKENGSWAGELCRTDADGNVIDLYLNINSFKQKKGTTAAYFSVVTDITELKIAQYRVEQLVEKLNQTNHNLMQKVQEQTIIIREVFERVPDVFIGTDTNLKIIYANRNVEFLFGVKESAVLGNNILDYLAQITDDSRTRLLKDCLSKQEGIMFELTHPFNNKIFRVELFPEIKGVSIYFRDITLAKKAEEEIHRSQRMYHFISKANDIILNAQNENEIFSNICDTAIGSGGFIFSWIGHPDKTEQTITPIIWSGTEDGYLSIIRSISTNQQIASGNGPSGKAVREGKVYYCNNIANDPDMLPWRDEALKRGYHSSIALPIKVADAVVAIFTLYASKPDYFSLDEIQLLLRVTENIGYALTAFRVDEEKRKAEEQLHKVLQAIEQSSASVVITDLKGDIEYVNPAFTKLTGYSYAETIGQNPRILKTGKTSDDEYGHLWDNLTHNKEWQGEFCNKKKNGELYWEYANISPIVNSQGMVINYVAIKENITERKKMEEEQKELVEIIENTSAFVGRAELNRKIVYLNRAFREVLGINKEEDITQISISDFSQKSSAISDEMQQSLNETGKWVGENVFIAKDGKQTPVLQIILIHKKQDGSPSHLSSTAIDLSAIKEKEEQLLLLNKEMTELARYLQNVSEIEKKDVAREIHDELGQYLTAMKMGVAWIQKHSDADKKILENKLAEVQEIVVETIASFKKIHSSLHPAMLEDVGLHAAVEWYITSVERFSHQPIILNSNMQRVKISFATSLPLYRVVQECITNAVRYSRATKISVLLFTKDNTVYVRIKDNGIGFVLADVDTKLHHGLLGMKERVYAINGQITIHSMIGKGTYIKVVVPIDDALSVE